MENKFIKKEEEKPAEAVIAKPELVTVVVNLPQGADKCIDLAGRRFISGESYQVPNEVKWALLEQQNRVWAHESSLQKSENTGRKRRNDRISFI